MTNINSSDLQPLTFTDNILLSGILAKVYAEVDYSSPVQNWAYALPNRELVIGRVHYRVNSMRLMLDGQESAGVQMTVLDKSGPTEKQSLYFFPLQSLRSMVMNLKGVQLG